MKILEQYKNDDFLKVIDQFNLTDLIEFSKTIKTLFVVSNQIEKEDIKGVFSIFFESIDVVETQKDTLEALKKSQYDLVILSTHLEDTTATKLIEEIRLIKRGISILAISEEEDNFVELIRLGIDGYIIRPVQAEQFVKIMEKLLDNMLHKQRLIEYRENLENLVDKKTQELQEINDNLQIQIEKEVNKNTEQQKQLFLQAKMASLGEMISNIAHQWRQPLSIITTVASSTKLTNEYKTLKSDQLNLSMDKIVNQAEQLSNTIDVFRDFLDGDKEYIITSLEKEIDQSLELSNSIFIEQNIELINKTNHANTIKCKVAHGELAQVFLYIFSNSKDAFIERKIKNPWIQIDLEVYKDNFILSIEDNGGGIKEEIIDNIFEPYFTTKHQSQGTGLGLHMSYRIIVESLGGQFYAKNTQNGAKFFIELPVMK